MPRDFLEGVREEYDVIVIGSGLAGLTAANTLARAGHSVLLLEHHSQLGGLATWFHRPGGHIFDVSLHGFPVGMIKSCRRYWTRQIADSIVQLKQIRFDNPMFSLSTTFDREDFTQLLIGRFGIAAETVKEFFDTARSMNFYDDQAITTGELFERFFPGREDVVRLLMEPITYANGSTLEDPALTYGIVFSNFMSKGVFTFQGGTDRLIGLMQEDMKANGVDVRVRSGAEKIQVSGRRVKAVAVGGRQIKARAVLSNANLKGTIFNLVGREHFEADFAEEADAVRLNNSSTQVYMGLKPGEHVDEEACGDLLFSSTAPAFRTDMLLSRNVTSRTYSFYYPRTRPQGGDRSLDRGQHQRQLSRLGRSFQARLPARKTRPDRGYTGRDHQVCAGDSGEARLRGSRHAVDVRTLHQTHPRGQLRHQVRGTHRQPRVAGSDRRAVSRR